MSVKFSALGLNESSNTPSRRTFVRSALIAAAAATLGGSPVFKGVAAFARSSTADLIRDTFDGLVAFVVPGPDSYSVAQGMSTPEPGGLDCGITSLLIDATDESAPYLPQFSAIVAGILNNLADVVHPGATGSFVSPFARLAFSEKAAVFEIMDGTEPLRPLAGVLPVFVGFLCYSEAGVFDVNTRTVTGRPVGWTISKYEGVADGRDEFLGYFENRRRATS